MECLIVFIVPQQSMKFVRVWCGWEEKEILLLSSIDMEKWILFIGLKFLVMIVERNFFLGLKFCYDMRIDF